MSTEAAKEFLAKIVEDQRLAEKVREAGTDRDEIIRLGNEIGLEFTAEEMKAVGDETADRIGEGLRSFLEKVSADGELGRKLEEAGTDFDGIIRLGRENGCEFTADDLMALQSLTVVSDVELSDDDLEKVAGGAGTLSFVFNPSVQVALMGVVQPGRR